MLVFQNDQEEADPIVADIEDSLNLMKIGTRKLESNTRIKSQSSHTGSKNGSKSNMLQSSLDEIQEDAKDSEIDESI